MTRSSWTLAAALTAVALCSFLSPSARGDEPTPEVVTKKIDLFNGKNLDGWSVFLAGKEPGKDPDGVFTSFIFPDTESEELPRTARFEITRSSSNSSGARNHGVTAKTVAATADC